MSEAKIFNVVVGTAGHIDHGKSSLVMNLTGQDPDRLKEEKERGLTIDLGYAELDLASGLRVGIIDVPGHERFVRNMVAGATGVDYVMLVVAADDGVMPQTREHLDIMSMLGLANGVVVLTKIDLVDPEFRELVEDDLRDYLSDTFLADAKIIPVSSETKEGIDHLLHHLETELPKISRADTQGVFRMPIQRAFSVKGFGTVVTGVPVSGTVNVGDTVEVLPGSHTTRVRGIEAYHKKTETASAGHRAALNITDVDYKVLGRGHVVATPGFFEESRLIELELHYLKSNKKPLTNRAQLTLHLGTQDVPGRVTLLDHKSLLPGETGLAQIFVEEPVVVGPGDRFVIRRPSPSVTIGGGVVIGESERRLKRFRDRVTTGLQRKRDSVDDSLQYLESLLIESGSEWQETKTLAIRAKLTVDDVKNVLAPLVEAGEVHSLERGNRVVHESGIKKVEHLLVAELETLSRENPLRMAHPKKDLARNVRLAPPLFDLGVRRLCGRGAVKTTAGGEYYLSGHEVSLSDSQRELAGKITDLFSEACFAPPTVDDLGDSLSVSPKGTQPIVDLLLQQGVLRRIKGGMVFHAERVEEAKQLVVGAIRERGELLATEFKDLIKSTRKFAIPLLEYMDELGVTRRDGNRRLLTSEWETESGTEEKEGKGESL